MRGTWIRLALIGTALLTITACGRAPEPAWTVALPEDCVGAQPRLSRDWAILQGLRQLKRWRRSDGQAGAPWPEADPRYVDAVAVLPEHAAVRNGGTLRVLGLSDDRGVLEAAADAGPYSDGQRFYWSSNGAVLAWDAAQGSVTLADLGPGSRLDGAISGEGVTLLSAQRLSALQVTLNKGLVVSGQAVALDAQGRELWRYDELPQGGALIHAGTAYFADHDVLVTRLHAVGLGDGQPRWTRGFGNAPSDPAKARRSGFTVPETPRVSPPLAVDGLIVVAVEDGDGPRVLALDPASGETRWDWSPLSDVLEGVGNDGPAFSFPVLAGELVLLGVGGRVRALRPDGKRAWAFKAGGPVRRAPAADPAGWLAADLTRLHYFGRFKR